MRRALLGSVLFHAIVLALAYFGLPAARLDETALPEPAMIVELVTVAEKSNVPPAAKPKAKAAEPEKKPAPPQPQPQPPAPPEPAPQPAEPEAAPAPSAPQPPAPPPPAKAEAREPPAEVAPITPAPRKPKAPPAPEVAKAEPKEEPKKAEPKAEPKQEAKEEPKKEPEKPAPPAAKTKAEPKPEPAMDFAAVLRSLETAKTPAEAGKKAPGDAAARSDAPSSAKSANGTFDSSLPVTMSEIDMVRRQIEQCWNLPGGAKNAQDMVVTITVEMNADGTPRSATIDDQAQMRSNPFYRVAAESALRAVLNPRCHPFKLPREKYERWKTMTLVFNPKEMFGT